MLGQLGVIFAVGLSVCPEIYYPILSLLSCYYSSLQPDWQLSEGIPLNLRVVILYCSQQSSKTLNSVPLLLPGEHQPGRFHGRFRLAAGC